MHKIYRYECETCDFSMPSGWAAQLYATDVESKRHICGHPGEAYEVKLVTGMPIEAAHTQGRTGALDNCVCIICLYQGAFDLERDPLQCPSCSDGNMHSANSFLGEAVLSAGRVFCKDFEGGYVLTQFSSLHLLVC